MEIADSARKHGIADADIEHAVRNALRVVPGRGRDLYIGGDRNGHLLEVVVLTVYRGEVPLRSTRCRCDASSTISSER